MRELRSCDFCDADAVGTFEIVPPELEPTEAEQRRVVLCPDCRERLEALVEPLLARAGAAVEETDASDEDHDGSSVVATADGSTRTRTRTASPNATVSDGTDGSATESEPEPDDDSNSASGLEDGITFERDEAAIDGDGGDGGNGASDATESERAASETTDSDEASATVPLIDGNGPDGATETNPPTAYGKVLRLLHNREFPMQRSAVKELAAGAYDLENDQAEAIVDYAVADGEFTEERGMLHRS